MSGQSFNFLFNAPYRGLPPEIVALIFNHITPSTFLAMRSVCRLFNRILTIDWYCSHYPKKLIVGTQEYYELPNKLKHGKYRNVSPSSLVSTTYDKGLINGDFILSNLSGEYAECIHYENGKRDGWTTIWPDIDKRNYVMCLYKSGMHLKNVSYNGSKKLSECFYNDQGQLDGVITFFDRETISSQLAYKHGLLHGECKKFDNKGRHVSTVMMEEGKVLWRILWWSNRTIRCILPGIESFRGGASSIEGRSYYSSGQLRTIKYYDKKTRRHGPYTIFHKKGFILETGTFDHGSRSEIRTIYGFSGKARQWDYYGYYGRLLRRDLVPKTG